MSLNTYTDVIFGPDFFGTNTDIIWIILLRIFSMMHPFL